MCAHKITGSQLGTNKFEKGGHGGGYEGGNGGDMDGVMERDMEGSWRDRLRGHGELSQILPLTVHLFLLLSKWRGHLKSLLLSGFNCQRPPS